MKLGICYMLFDGEEFLEPVTRSIRNQADFVAVTWQQTSYHGNKNETNLKPLIERLKAEGLIDKDIYYEPDLKLSPKENELALRNLGLQASREAGCTHHVSADVDEFYVPEQVEHAKNTFGEHDCSMVQNIIYYKKPTWQITPHNEKFISSFIHPVTANYEMIFKYPYRIEITRRLNPYEKCRVYEKDEIVMHHMSYVRKDIRKKLQNSTTGDMYDIDKFVADFDKYQLGERLVIAPDFLTRRTRLVDNIFGL